MNITSLRKTASHTLLIILSLVIVFHVLVLSGVVPYDIVWGGRLNSVDEMVVFELVSIAINLVMVTVVAIHSGKLGIAVSPLILKGVLWVMAILFFLNTIGNLMSISETEKIIFTPLTAILCLLTILVVTGKQSLPLRRAGSHDVR